MKPALPPPTCIVQLLVYEQSQMIGGQLAGVCFPYIRLWKQQTQDRRVIGIINRVFR